MYKLILALFLISVSFAQRSRVIDESELNKVLGRPITQTSTTPLNEGNSASQNTTALEGVINSISGKGTVIIPKGNYKVSNFVIPDSVTIKFVEGGHFEVPYGATLTVKGTIDAGLFQVFEGTGYVDLSEAKTEKVYAEWFGIKASSTDNSDQLKRAIQSKAKKISFEDTGYIFLDQFIFSDNVNLSSEKETKFYLKDTTGSRDYYNPNASIQFEGSEVILKNIKFIGNNNNLLPWGGLSSGSLLCAVNIIGATKVLIDNCSFNYSIYAGLEMINSSNVTITNSDFSHNKYGGLFLRGVKNAFIMNNTASYNESRDNYNYGPPTGIDAYIFGYGMSASGRFEYPHHSGVFLDNENITFINNTCINNGRNGIDVHGGLGVKILNNYIYGFGGRAIYAVNEGGGEVGFEKPVANILISGNYIRQNNSIFIPANGYNTATGGYTQCGIMAGSWSSTTESPIVPSGDITISNNVIDTMDTGMSKFAIYVYTNIHGPRVNSVNITGNSVLYTDASYSVVSVGGDIALLPERLNISNNIINGQSLSGAGIFIKNDFRQSGVIAGITTYNDTLNSVSIMGNIITGQYGIEAIRSEDESSYILGNTYNGKAYVPEFYGPMLEDVINSKVNIRDNIFQETKTNGRSSIIFNYKGYNNDTTQPRDFQVFDGKELELLRIYGPEKLMSFYGSFDLYGYIHAQNYFSSDNSVGLTDTINGMEFKNGLYTKSITEPKKYVALISQSGTSAPTATVLDNTVGTIVWSYVDVGQYRGTLTGAFTSDKTFCLNGGVAGSVTLRRETDNSVILETLNPAGAATNSLMIKLSIEIRIYQ